MNIRYTILTTISLVFLWLSHAIASSIAPPRQLYEIKIYYLQNQEQEEQIERYLRQAYLPALQRAGINTVGVFKPIEGDSAYGERIYVFIPYSSAAQFMKVPQVLEKDKKYQKDGSAYMDAAHDNPPYQRIESILLQAFEGMPHFQPTNLKVAPSERIYELRSYESATENLFRNKVDMFNKGEIEIFERLDFNPVFFGEVIAGCHMPNLMYMTAFSDKASREEHWEAFRTDPKWAEMKVMEEYQDNVSHIDIVLLHPTSYSEL